MRNIRNKIIAMGLGIMVAGTSVGCINTYSVTTAEAHPGRTNSNGGHKDNKNKSGLGSYHYHCEGHPAHLHTGGVCPCASDLAAVSGAKSASSSDREFVKKVQQALNNKGHDCGEADGIAGTKTKGAVQSFQEDNGLTVDGVIGDQVKEALGIEQQKKVIRRNSF